MILGEASLSNLATALASWSVEVLPSSELRRKNEEPRVQTQTSQTGIDDIKAKLLGKMKK